MILETSDVYQPVDLRLDLTLATFNIAVLDCCGTAHHHFLFSQESYILKQISVGK